MDSCIYEGRVKHTRTSPAVHTFDYKLFLMYLDLEELPQLFEKRWFWSSSRPALARFRRRDHLGPEHQPLADAVRDLVAAEIGTRPEGPIRLLTNLSYFGFCFNPVSFYYCFAADGTSLDYIVTEVNNTPWGERQSYVLCCDPRQRFQRIKFDKQMHVSPFNPMEMKYRWCSNAPQEMLTLNLETEFDSEIHVDATMALRRREITSGALAYVLVQYPWMTARVAFSIYWQALRLWWKRNPIYDHPGAHGRGRHDKPTTNQLKTKI